MSAGASTSFAPDRRLLREECLALTEHADLDALMRAAAARRDVWGSARRAVTRSGAAASVDHTARTTHSAATSSSS